MIRNIPAHTTNVHVRKDKGPDMRIADQKGFKINERRKFQRPAKQYPYIKETNDIQTDNKEDRTVYTHTETANTPKGITTRYQNINYREGDK